MNELSSFFLLWPAVAATCMLLIVTSVATLAVIVTVAGLLAGMVAIADDLSPGRSLVMGQIQSQVWLLFASRSRGIRAAPSIWASRPDLRQALHPILALGFHL